MLPLVISGLTDSGNVLKLFPGEPESQRTYYYIWLSEHFCITAFICHLCVAQDLLSVSPVPIISPFNLNQRWQSHIHKRFQWHFVRTDKSLAEVGRSGGFFCRHDSTKCWNSFDHSGEDILGATFWAMWYKALMAFMLK